MHVDVILHCQSHPLANLAGLLQRHVLSMGGHCLMMLYTDPPAQVCLLHRRLLYMHASLYTC